MQNSVRRSLAERAPLRRSRGSNTTCVRPLAVAQVDEHAAAVVASRCTQPIRTTCLPTSLGAQRAAVMGSLQVGEELGMAGTLAAPVREHVVDVIAGGLSDRTLAHRDRPECWYLRNAPARPLSRQLLRWLQLRRRVLAVLSRAYRQGTDRDRVPAARAQRGGAAVLGRLLRRRRKRVRRLSLLAGSAADLVVRSPRVGVPARRATRTIFAPTPPGGSSTTRPRRAAPSSCAGAVAAKFGFDPAPLAELLEWAEIIDGALFPTPRWPSS